MIYDLAIVGSGSMGAAGAFFATRAGLSVAMIDVHTTPNTEGSHCGNT